MTSLDEILIAVCKQQAINQGLSLRDVQRAMARASVEYTIDETVSPLFDALNSLDGVWLDTVANAEVMI